MIWIYRFLFLPALLIASPYYLGRMRRRGGYGKGFISRFGFSDPLPPKRTHIKRIWFHAVSVGEVLAIGPVIRALTQKPEIEIFLTTTTSTGYKLAKERYANILLGISYFPIDFLLFSSLAWKGIAPDLAILTESERWPEHLYQASKRGVPVVIANGRVSDRSYRRMRALRWLLKPLVGNISRTLAVEAVDSERLKELGIAGVNTTVTGNIKLDVTLPLLSEKDRSVLRRELGFGDDSILVGASTWPGEEAALLEAWEALRRAGHRCHLLLVPRHAERRRDIRALLEARGVAFHFRSTGSATSEVEVAVADTTGELSRLLQLATLVFVGKSLSPHGEGQTPVEAAVLGKPILFGPGMSNFRAITESLLTSGAARRVRDANDLIVQIGALFTDPPECERMSIAARQWHERNRGAVTRTVAAIEDELAALRK